MRLEDFDNDRDDDVPYNSPLCRVCGKKPGRHDGRGRICRDCADVIRDIGRAPTRRSSNARLIH